MEEFKVLGFKEFQNMPRHERADYLSLVEKKALEYLPVRERGEFPEGYLEHTRFLAEAAYREPNPELKERARKALYAATIIRRGSAIG